MYKGYSCEATITTRYGVFYKEVEARCIFPLLSDPDYQVIHRLLGIWWDERGKHFDFQFAISAKDHEVSQLEVDILLRKYCRVQALQ